MESHTTPYHPTANIESFNHTLLGTLEPVQKTDLKKYIQTLVQHESMVHDLLTCVWEASTRAINVAKESTQCPV